MELSLPDGPEPSLLLWPRCQAALQDLLCNDARSVHGEPVLLLCHVPGVNVRVHL